MAYTLCFCCSTGAIHIRPNGGILLAHSRSHVYTQLFFASLGLMATNKQEKFTFPKVVRSGPQNKTDKSDCGISVCRWARAGGGKGKWRAEEKKRERDCSCVSSRGFLWLSLCRPYLLRRREVCMCVCVLPVWSAQLDCTIPHVLFSHIHMLEYSTC